MISKTYIDKIANTTATSPTNDIPQPSEEQKKAGTYKKGHLNIYGLNIAIENPKDSIRSGVDRNGKHWSIKLKNHYGYILGTVGKDKDHVDVFIGPSPNSEKVYIVNQKNSDNKFDEHKILLGWDSFPDAVKGYLDNYEKRWDMISSVHQSDINGIKDWLKNGNTKVPYKG